MLTRRIVFLAFFSAAALVLVAGCSVESRKAKHTQKAEAYLAEGRLDRAEIEFLNVIKIDPKDTAPLGRLGSIYFEQGQLGRALPYLARAIEVNDRDLGARSKLAALLFSVGNRPQAAAEAETILDQDPAHPEGIVILAECATTPEDFEKVADRLARAGAAAESSAAAWVARGIVLAKQGKTDEAMSALRRSVGIDDRFAPAHAALAALYMASQQTAEADAALAKAAEISGPRSPRTLQYAMFKTRLGDVAGGRRILEEVIRKAPDYVPAVLRLADVLGLEGRYAEAEEVLQPILTRQPNHPEALLMRSRAYLAQGRPDKAWTDVDLLVRMYPKSAEAHYEAARVHLAKPDVARALDSLHLAIEAAPEFSEALILKARIHLGQGDSTVAIKTLSGLLEKQPRNRQALLLLAEAYRAQNDLTAALETCDTLEAFHPRQEATAVLRGELLRQMERPAEARAAFEEALARNPDSVRALDEIVILDVQDHRMDTAVARVEEAIARRPEVPELRLTLGKLNMIRGDTAKAEEQLREAVALNKNAALGYVLLARLYLDAGKQDAAIQSLEEVVRVNPRDESAVMLLASLHEGQGDIEKARRVYESLLALSPNTPAVLNNLAYLLEKHTKELEKAYELARRARELLPGEPSIADTLGWILYRRGDYRLAAPLLREAALKSPDVALARYRLGTTLYMLGMEKEAAVELSEAVKLGLEDGDAGDAKARLALLTMRAAGGATIDADALKAHLGSHPDDPMALIAQGDAFLSQGEHARALQSYRAAAVSSPHNGLAQMGLGKVELARGNLPKAMEHAREARQVMPDNVAALAFLGKVALASNDTAWAHTLLQEALRRLPDDPDLALDAARAAYSQGQIEEALRAFAVVLARAPTPDIREQVDLIESQRKPPIAPTTIALARARLTRNPDDVPALMVLAGTGEREEAVAALEAVLKVYPGFAPAKRDLALLLAREGNADARVIPLASQALEVFAGDSALVKALGLAAARQGQYRVALPLIERVIEENQEDAVFWYYLGLTRAAVASQDAARGALEKALQLGLSPEHAANARKRLEELQTAAIRAPK